MSADNISFWEVFDEVVFHVEISNGGAWIFEGKSEDRIWPSLESFFLEKYMSNTFRQLKNSVLDLKFN